jgi:hypothetical protein
VEAEEVFDRAAAFPGGAGEAGLDVSGGHDDLRIGEGRFDLFDVAGASTVSASTASTRSVCSAVTRGSVCGVPLTCGFSLKAALSCVFISQHLSTFSGIFGALTEQSRNSEWQSRWRAIKYCYPVGQCH